MYSERNPVSKDKRRKKGTNEKITNNNKTFTKLKYKKLTPQKV